MGNINHPTKRREEINQIWQNADLKANLIFTWYKEERYSESIVFKVP